MIVTRHRRSRKATQLARTSVIGRFPQLYALAARQMVGAGKEAVVTECSLALAGPKVRRHFY